MPMFDYLCKSCGFAKEHFVLGSEDKICPKCKSSNYTKQFSKFKSEVEYSNTHEYQKMVLDPAVKEVYNKIGAEALDEDTKTLDNVFGADTVLDTLATKDD